MMVFLPKMVSPTTCIPTVAYFSTTNATCNTSAQLAILQSGNIFETKKILQETCNMPVERCSSGDTLLGGKLQKQILANVAPCCNEMPYYCKRNRRDT